MVTFMLRGDDQEFFEIMIPIINDFSIEGTETFTVSFTVVSDSGDIELYEPSMVTITILDDDGRVLLLFSGILAENTVFFVVPRDVVVGFEQSLYQTSEDMTFVEICAAIFDAGTLLPLEPADATMLDPSFSATFDFSLTQVTALGKKL